MHIIRSETLRRRLASAKSLASKSLTDSLTKSLAETVGQTFRARQASPQSLKSDYMPGSPQDSLRDSFFLRWKLKNQKRHEWKLDVSLMIIKLTKSLIKIRNFLYTERIFEGNSL